jgi:hypothetical protein
MESTSGYSKLPKGAKQKVYYVARVVSKVTGEVLQEGDKVLYKEEGT